MEVVNVKPTKDIYMEFVKALAERSETANDPDNARSFFDHMMNSGYKLDDRCVAKMIAAYAKNNLLDKALDMLLTLEKDGSQPCIETYTVLGTDSASYNWLKRQKQHYKR
ncbi:hypothetical protein ZIOFF_035277 [Zingiber officinale]|uniref:Pentatricopeptide repeat-containing protein n=1 Tax=Zingiber officinale TaxID=94328 RepID=A0A8J5KXI2_ZINOF|nr:hypothetical protein ZIOFF_035277 [Zingiber officinale]